MKRIFKFILPVLILASFTTTKKIASPNGISEIKYLDINDSKQYVLIRGKDIRNPVLLFLHGGPGASATALLRKYNSKLEDHFTVVYWDQRNSGKSFSQKTPKDEIKVANYLKDLDFLTAYLKNKFNVDKIFLVGHSWVRDWGCLRSKRTPKITVHLLEWGRRLPPMRVRNAPTNIL